MDPSDEDTTSNVEDEDTTSHVEDEDDTQEPIREEPIFTAKRPSSIAPQLHVDGKTPWTTGICNCFDDVGNCCVTCFCPCVTFGQIAEIVNKGHPGFAPSAIKYMMTLVVVGIGPCLYSFIYRVSLRGQYGIEGSTFTDCMAHFCCEFCALCQEYRELNNRGFDMDIGWQANRERRNKKMLSQNQTTTMAPFVEPMKHSK